MTTGVTTRARTAAARRHVFPVIEIFGPTVQGEGPDAGLPAYFVRFGGCDYRCAWCDSMYAVEPAAVRAHAESLDADDILGRLEALSGRPELVVLSGGNPALLDLGGVVDDLHAHGHRVAVETQGSRWRDWLAEVDRLIVSPKPPSSGMTGTRQSQNFANFMTAAQDQDAAPILKVATFDDTDLEWAEGVHAKYRGVPFFLSVGTDVGLDDEATLAGLRRRFQWLATEVARRPSLADVRVLPQLHVVAWGTARGV